MKTFNGFQTSDGVIHATKQAADRHASERYGNAVQAFARQLVAIEKYGKMIEFLDTVQTISTMAKIVRLSEDITLEPDND